VIYIIKELADGNNMTIFLGHAGNCNRPRPSASAATPSSGGSAGGGAAPAAASRINAARRGTAPAAATAPPPPGCRASQYRQPAACARVANARGAAQPARMLHTPGSTGSAGRVMDADGPTLDPNEWRGRFAAAGSHAAADVGASRGRAALSGRAPGDGGVCAAVGAGTSAHITVRLSAALASASAAAAAALARRAGAAAGDAPLLPSAACSAGAPACSLGYKVQGLEDCP